MNMIIAFAVAFGIAFASMLSVALAAHVYKYFSGKTNHLVTLVGGR